MQADGSSLLTNNASWWVFFAQAVLAHLPWTLKTLKRIPPFFRHLTVASNFISLGLMFWSRRKHKGGHKESTRKPVRCITASLKWEYKHDKWKSFFVSWDCTWACGVVIQITQEKVQQIASLYCTTDSSAIVCHEHVLIARANILCTWAWTFFLILN